MDRTVPRRHAKHEETLAAIRSLRRRRRGPATLGVLAEALGVSRGSAWKRVRTLRRYGLLEDGMLELAERPERRGERRGSASPRDESIRHIAAKDVRFRIGSGLCHALVACQAFRHTEGRDPSYQELAALNRIGTPQAWKRLKRLREIGALD